MCEIKLHNSESPLNYCGPRLRILSSLFCAKQLVCTPRFRDREPAPRLRLSLGPSLYTMRAFFAGPPFHLSPISSLFTHYDSDFRGLESQHLRAIVASADKRCGPVLRTNAADPFCGRSTDPFCGQTLRTRSVRLHRPCVTLQTVRDFTDLAWLCRPCVSQTPTAGSTRSVKSRFERNSFGDKNGYN